MPIMIANCLFHSLRRAVTRALLTVFMVPAAVIARLHGLQLQVIDCGLAADLSPHPRLLLRKVAHGTRNARVGHAMSLDQAHAAIRAGMEIGDSLRGNLIVCAGLGVGMIGAVPYVLVKAFPAAVRFSGLSFSYNLAYAIFGGLTPIMVTSLMKFSPLGPAYYVAGICTLGLLVGIYLLATKR